ncbi:MAG TPA: SMC family ATPase [Nocardioides sp.]|nr:SMC family ATPase [Nocardioides sp.]
MRLHHLEIVAFGPFADRVEVDFDALSDAGLFLLTGPTGAGKSSVLDAVCFALYGAVPGDRQSAKRLRSDHAPAGVAPVVTLEFSVAGRRFRARRSPAWERPRRRGTGTTREHASVVLSERVDGRWTALATRLDEAGHLVGELLGMTLTQFCQVQLLPQGRFQAFLRAESDERHRLLQRLFRTARFEDIERWLRERRRTLRHESARHHDLVAEAVSRFSEAAGRPLPTHWDLHDLGLAVDEIESWSAAVGDDAALRAAEAATRVVSASQAEAAARRDHDAARSLAERQERRARAVARSSALRQAEPAHRARVQCLQAARRAAAVHPLCEEADRARDALDRAVGVAAGSLTRARDLLGRPGCPASDLADAARTATAAAAEARARQADVEELEVLEASIAQARVERDDVAARLERLQGRAGALPEEIARSRDQESAAARALERVPTARQEVAAASERLEAARLVVRLLSEKAAAEARHRVAVDAAQERKEEWLHIQERRLEGMAAEIAGALAVGGCCPVCGSCDHPAPARPSPGAPDAAAERAARRAVDDAEAERHARALAVTDLDTRILLARERAHHRPVDLLEQEHAQATETLARLEACAATQVEATRRREHHEAELADLVEARTTMLAERAALDATIADQQARARALTDQLAALLAGSAHPSVAALADHLDRVATACGEAVRDAAALEQAEAAAEESGSRARAALVAAGFGNADEVRDAVLPTLLLERVEEEVRSHDAALVAVTAELDDPELQAAAAVGPPDLEGSATCLAGCERELAEARTAAAVAGQRAARLASLASELGSALAAWSPVQADLELADRLASLVDGTSPDNRLRMRLSAYVLAYRLAQVVAAANERLARMFDHRYALEHTGDRGVGETRGGLSLRVRDDWTGESRDPATLSGGETFVVSLALALGLADVIAHEAGGSQLDTLFVDEGFGTLDAETLDQVLDTLDSLRDGGRVVGVVSHVAEMQTRIPTQLHVHKRSVGSTLSQGG